MNSICHEELPKGKSLVKLMMKWQVVEKEVLGGGIEKYLKVGCPNCSYLKENLLRNGWNSYAAHYIACVGKSNLPSLIAEKTNANPSSLVLHDPRTEPSRDEKCHFVIATDTQKSTHMWLQLITLKSMPLWDVECEWMRKKSNILTQSAPKS